MPKVLLVDIETSFLTCNTWGIWEQNVPVTQIVQDWSVLAVGARWQGAPAGEVLYKDQALKASPAKERRVLQFAWKLLDQAQAVVTHNGKAFDAKRLNARFVYHDMQPVRPYKHYDTKCMAKKSFDFTSNKLEYLCEFLGTPYKKLKHAKFPGNALWTECQKANPEAWREMQRYNKNDVLALEGVFDRLAPWDAGMLHAAGNMCTCGSTSFMKRGTTAIGLGVYQLYRCNGCGKATRGGKNLLGAEARQQQKRGIS